MIPGFYLTLNPGEPQSWMHFCPILAQQLQIGQIFRGELVPGFEVAAGVCSTLGLAGLFMMGTVYLFSRESMLFGD